MPDRAEANSAIVRCRSRVVPLRTVNKKLRERLAAQPAVPEDVKSEKSRKSRERKRSKRPIRQRKEKYRERECRANRKQHYKLSKPSARHDMRNANATSVTYFPPNSHGRERCGANSQQTTCAYSPPLRPAGW